MPKIAASLNDSDAEESALYERLPKKGLSAFIKEALKLYCQWLDGEIVVMPKAEHDALIAGANSHPSQSVPLSITPDALTAAISKGIVEGIKQSGLSLVASTNGNGHHANSEPEHEDPDDPLVRAMIGLSFDDQFG